MEKIRALLKQQAIGNVVVVHADVGAPLQSTPKYVEKELGGGGLLNVGLYCVQLACMVFSGEKPESIVAFGFLHETG